MSWTETITIGELTTTRIVYAAWTGSIVAILSDAGLGWTSRLLIRDVDVDMDKGSIRLSMAALGQPAGEDVLDITITLVRNEEES